MSFENKKVKRIFSAKISSSNQRQRPFSGSSGTYTRNQLINTIYNQDQILHLSQRATSAKNLPAKIVQQVQKSKKIVVKQSKKKEEMQNQIMHLKKTINQLVQQLQLQKGKTQSLRKKSHKFSKILTAEYENQVHWNSNTLNTHLIAGIKNQYQNLKQKCQQLSQQNQKIKKQSSFTKQLEYITYIQKLENENKCLVNKIKRLSSGSIQILTNNQSQRMATDYIISEIESQNRKLYQKNNELKGKYKMCRDNLKDRDNKIAILEKLAIQKDNNYHALQKKQANTKKQIIYIKEKLQSMTKDYQILQSQYTKRTHLLQRQLQTRQNNYTQKLSQTLNEKNYKIGILERQSLYFQNMVKELRSTNTQLNHQVQNAKMMKTTDRAIMSIINMNYEEQNARNQKEQEKNNAADLFLKEALFFMKNNKGVYENNKRIPQKANKKYNESALKKRRVSLNQIQQIVQFLKLKLLSKKIHIQSLLQLFTHKSSKNQWQIEYINMQQIRTILQSELINIPSQQSLLLARYLIEDVNEEYVYCDENNQNNRQIVKSIIRSLVKDIDRIVQNQIYQKQAQIVMNNYRDKIRANLQTVEPTGYVSKRRFLDILKGIGAECSSEAQEILLARLAAHSNCITKLSYQQTFKTL